MSIKNIIHICYFSSDYPGNFIASLSRLTAETEKQYSVYFLFPVQAQHATWLSMLPVASDHIFFCDFSPKSLYVCCKKLLPMLGNQLTIAHTHFIDYFHLLAVKLCFKNNVCHYHMAAPNDNTLKRKIRKALCNIIYANSTIIAVSEPVANRLRLYFKSALCECVTNAIDFERLDTYSAHCSQRIDLDFGEFSLLIHGSDFYRKGVDLAIQAVEQLNDECNVKCSLLITAHPTSVAESLVQKHSRSNAAIKVIDVTREIKDLYDSIDAFISPSRSEAFAYAVAESSYCRCQVIASDVPGQNTMKDIPGIIWIESNNIQSLKEAILTAIERKKSDRLEAIGVQQKEFVRENYGIDLWVNRIINIYQEHFRF